MYKQKWSPCVSGQHPFVCLSTDRGTGINSQCESMLDYVSFITSQADDIWGVACRGRELGNWQEALAILKHSFITFSRR